MVDVGKNKASPVKEEESKESKTKKEHQNLQPYFKPEDLIIKKGYRVHKRVGYGSFGQVFKGSRVDTGEYVAIKVEKMEQSELFKTNTLLYNEGKTMRELFDALPIPYIHYSNASTEDDGVTYYFLVMDYMGLNLTELLYREIDKKFTPQTCLHITTQILRTMKALHNKGYIHRDIKADNFLLGGSEASRNQVFLLDYGLATQIFQDTQKKENHVPMREERGVVGTGMFLSINSHNMKTKSRRDDLEEVAYLFAYLWTGTLPWRNLDEEDHDKLYELIKKSKETASLEELFNGMPKEYKDFYIYTRNLEYEETPDYDHYINTFEDLMRSMNLDPKVFKMDWDPPDPQLELDLMIREMDQVVKQMEKYKP